MHSLSRLENTTDRFSLRGLGNQPVVGKTGSTIASMAATGAATTGSLLASMAGLSIAGPIGAGVAALIGIGVAVANLFGGCGDTCTLAANLDNEVENLAKQNLDAYMAMPIRHKSAQLAAVNNFDTMWQAYVQAENQPATGSQGAKSIQERSRGGRWDYFSYYRDPIANDPNVVPDPIPATPVDTLSTLSTLVSNPIAALTSSPMLLIGGFGILALFLLSNKR